MLVISPAARTPGRSRSPGTGLARRDVGSAPHQQGDQADSFAQERQDASVSGSTYPRAITKSHANASPLSDEMNTSPQADRSHPAFSSKFVPTFSSLVAQLTEDWSRGEAQAIEDYLRQLDPADTTGAVELIYHEFCLAESAGWEPDPSVYIARFPRYSEQLGRLLELHGACSPSLIDRWVGCTPENYTLPEVGDSIGPYVLCRELGRGSFARVFLAEQADLENRLVVAKVSTRMTREPWLLAKSRHAHIVDILSHAEVDDGAFQLICMPFWGGATLGAVLEHRRARGRAPRAGSDLLADLDAVAAPEFPTVHPARPAREILRGLSYNAALAWVAARLAEALSHAFSRGVAHGDVKPSNILLAADGSPMLLDFNLAHDTSPGSGTLQDRGGTLPYMPPERLLMLAEIAQSGLESPQRFRAEPTRNRADRSSGFLRASFTTPSPLDIEPELVPGGSTEDFPSSADIAPHRADIYSLGIVLLEGFTGRMPEAVGISDTLAHVSGPERTKLTALAYAKARNRGAAALIRDFEAGGGRQIDPGVRSILECCLDPDPSRRYRDASELAEDLDRWRTGRRLAFAAEPFVSVTIPRWVYTRRRSLAAAALALSVLFATSAVAILKLNTTSLTNAELKFDRFFDESSIYRLQRPYSRDSLNLDDPATIETASRVLKEYGVLESDDWLQSDDVRFLSQVEREELELWICEQAFRFSRVLAARPDSPADWTRALTLLDNASPHRAIEAFEPLRQKLRANLERSPQGDPTDRSAVRDPAPLWLEKYLLGVISETQSTFVQPGYANLRSNGIDARSAQAATTEALRLYESMLELRPESYWGHYRAAVAAHALGKTANTVLHLELCLEQRPDNPILRGQLAGCLALLGQSDDALVECNRAINGSPDFAEFYRTRAFIKVDLGQSDGLAEDLRDFEIRSGTLPRSIVGEALFAVARPFAPSTIDDDADDHPQIKRLAQPLRTVDRAELDARACLAKAIQTEIHDFDVARSEVNKILIIDPEHLMALAFRATQAAESGDFDSARRDLDRLLNHEDLYNYAREHPDLIRQLTIISTHLLRHRKTELAVVVASRAREVSRQLKDRWKQSAHVGLSHYVLARTYAVMGQNDPDSLDKCGRELYRSIRANGEFRAMFLKDHYFNEVRDRLLEQLPRVELMLEPSAVPLAPVVARSAGAGLFASNSEKNDGAHRSGTGSIKPFDR